jgi:protoporphyrinogen oxidase
MPKTVLIIGAGPAGLTAGYELVKKGFKVTVLERDNIVGGISRTINYKGFRFDIGGHRFFTKNREIEAWWENILHEDFLTRPRLSRWYYRKKFFDYPIKPLELLGVFGLVDSMKIALSYAKAKLKPIVPEISVADWCINNFGHYLAKPFFIDYNFKLWGVHPKYLSKDFTSQRIKGISFMSALKDALKKSLGVKDNNIKSLIEQFKYPKYGPGMMWEHVTRLIEAKKGKVLKGWKVVKIKHKNGKIVSVTAQNSKKNKKFRADYVLSTMPLRELIFSLEPKPFQEILDAAKFLRFRDFITVALMIDQPKTVPDTWVYTHDEGMKPIRAQIFKNWSPFMVPDASKSCIGFEYACNEGDELWNMSKEQLIEQAKQDLKRLSFASVEKVFDAEVIRLKEVYPVYLVGYEEKVNIIKAYLQNNFKDNSLQPIGRGGLHRYNNSDHSMMTALLAVKNILGEGKYDQWQVNTDAEYHEEKKS